MYFSHHLTTWKRWSSRFQKAEVESEIRSLLRLDDDPKLKCGDVDALARAHLADIHQRIEELTRMAGELERVIAQCAGGERGACTILGALRRLGNEPTSCGDSECRR